MRESEGRGRGLFTTRAVQAGDLLLCEKAFGYAYADPSDQAKSLLISTETNSVTMGAQAELLRLVAQKLFLSLIINDLHHGSYNSVGVTDIDGEPVVDT